MTFVPQRVFNGTDSDNVINAGYNLNEDIRDLMVGNGGNDVMQAGAGDDWMLGNAGNDILEGNRGNDMLFGGVGDDQLRGGIGADTLSGDYGADILRGDNGIVVGFIDTFVFNSATAGLAGKSGGFASDTILDFEAGIDILLFSGFDSADLTYTQVGSDVVVSLTGEYDLVTVLNASTAAVITASDF